MIDSGQWSTYNQSVLSARGCPDVSIRDRSGLRRLVWIFNMDRQQLRERVNLEDLTLVLTDFTSACDLRINLLDRDARIVLEFFPPDLLSAQDPSIQSLSADIDRLITSHSSRVEHLEDQHGLHSFLLPLQTDEEISGYLVSEPVFYSDDERKRFETHLLDLGISRADVRKQVRRHRICPKETFRARQRFLETAVKSLVRSREVTGELAQVNHLLKENEALRQRTERKLQTLSTLFSISRTFNSSLELDQVLQTIIDSVTRLLKVEVCSIMLYEESQGVLRIAAAQGLPAEIIREARVKPGEGISGHVARYHRSLLIDDVSKDPRFQTNQNRAEYRTTSALSVPILQGESLIGIINVNNKSSGAIFTAEDQNLLEAIADQTAVAVMNARHHENFRHKLRELQYVNNISQIIQSTLDLDKLLKVAIDLITELLGVENCSLMLVNEATQTLNIVIATGLDIDIVKDTAIRVGEGVSGHVAATGESLLLSNIEEDGRFTRRTSVEYNTRSALSVPLKAKDRVVGVINVNNKKNGEIFTQSDLQVLQTLSNQIAVALENARLYNRAQQKVIELTMLQQVGQVINSTLDLSNVLEHVIDQILKIFDADMGSLMLFDQTDGTLRITEQKGLKPDYAAGIRFKPGEGVAGRVFETGRPMLVVNSLDDPNYSKFEDETIGKTLMCSPIFVKGKVEGILSCEKRLDHTGAFSEENLDLMETISSQASIAIENANLYNDLLNLYLHTIQSLAAAIDAKDSYTHGHSRRVMAFSIAIARAMNLPESELNTLRHTALLHDIGKIGISETILQKPGKLTHEEFDYIKSHPVMGAHILESIEFLQEVRMQMKHHHEKFDGTGYPDGLKGDQIPLGARIIGVADTYDAMTSTRPYRKGLEHQVAVEEVRRCSGTQFDPDVVDAFLSIADMVDQLGEGVDDLEHIPHFHPRKSLHFEN